MTRIPDFKTVFKKHNLNAAIAGIITMGDSVYNSFGNSRRREFIIHRNLGT